MEIPPRHKIKVSIVKSDQREVNSFPLMVIFHDKLPASNFTNGHFVNIYPTDMEFIDFSMPLAAYDEKRNKVPLVNQHGSITISTEAKYLYFHANPQYQIHEFIEAHEFLV